MFLKKKLFSKAVSRRRASLKPTSVDMLVLLSKNMTLLTAE